MAAIFGSNLRAQIVTHGVYNPIFDVLLSVRNFGENRRSNPKIEPHVYVYISYQNWYFSVISQCDT